MYWTIDICQMGIWSVLETLHSENQVEQWMFQNGDDEIHRVTEHNYYPYY